MAAVVKSLAPVSAQPGRPLYQTVRDAIRGAIDAGMFAPGEQIPNTKEVSEQLSVSLVTAQGVEPWPRADKAEVARKLAERIAAALT